MNIPTTVTRYGSSSQCFFIPTIPTSYSVNLNWYYMTMIAVINSQNCIFEEFYQFFNRLCNKLRRFRFLCCMRYIQVTIKDIARELGISPSTVSRALKDHPDISPETKKAVNALAEKLNYQPNIVALSLRQSKTNTIGVIIPEIVHFFFSTVISGIEDVAYSAGYNVIWPNQMNPCNVRKQT